MLFLDADTRVFHRDAYIGAVFEEGRLSRVRLGNVDVVQDYRELSPCRPFHGMAGVVVQIADHLRDLRGRTIDERLLNGALRSYRDLGRSGNAKKTQALIHQGADVGYLEIGFVLFSRERHHLFNDLFASVCRENDLVQILLYRTAFRKVIVRGLGKAEHRGQAVVEIMGNAARQSSDGLETLGLPKPSRAFDHFLLQIVPGFSEHRLRVLLIRYILHHQNRSEQPALFGYK